MQTCMVLEYSLHWIYKVVITTLVWTRSPKLNLHSSHHLVSMNSMERYENTNPAILQMLQGLYVTKDAEDTIQETNL